MDKILKSLKKAAKNDYCFTMQDKDNPYLVEDWIDTGCYALNAILSDGDIYKGIPKGKRVVFAGPSSTAKSYFIMYLIKAFFENEKNPYVVVFESEGATITNMIKDFGIPEDKVIILPVLTVESFRTQITNLLDHIIELRAAEKKDPPNFLIALDSLGMLGTEKEYNDAVTGSDKTDMTRAKKIRSIFRLITLKLSLTQTTFLCANHTLANIGSMSPLPVMSGGGGITYSSDVTIMLSKAKEKDGTELVGAIITCRVDKSRYQPEGNKMKVVLMFKKGIYKHSHLIDLGLELGLIKKEGLSLVLTDGTKKRRKEIIRNADQYLVGKVLDELRDSIYNKFCFGSNSDSEFEDIIELNEDEIENGDAE